MKRIGFWNYAVVCGVVAALALAGCSRSDNADVMCFRTCRGAASYVLKGSKMMLLQPDDATYADSVSLIMPVTLGNCQIEALRDTILSIALGKYGDEPDSLVARWLRETATAMATDMESKAELVPDTLAEAATGYDIVSGYITHLTAEIMVYCIHSESYMPGAAHGIYSNRYVNYALADTGSIITLDKLFTPRGLERLVPRIAQQAQSMSDIVGATAVASVPEYGNFYISSEGEIVFSYQPYEIGSYAQGTINIPFYPYELVDYMTPYAVSLFHLEDLTQ